MKKRTIIMIAIAVAVFAFFGVVGYALFGSNKNSTDEISYYRELSLGEGNVICAFDLPTLDELGPYETQRFDHTAYRKSIFVSYSYSLILGYNEGEYAEKKTWLMDAYPTLDIGAMEDKKGPAVQFEMDGFDFRAIEGKEYPKHMMFIGTCDETQEIAIIYYSDTDLDCISRAIVELLTEETGWKNLAP